MMIEKNYRWIKVAANSNDMVFAGNHIVEIEIEGKKICLVKTASGLRACSSRCPHAGGDMSEGKVVKGNIVCPVHGYIFNLMNGRDSGNEGYFLKIYPVKEDAKGIYIGIEMK